MATQDISKQFNQLRNSFRKELRESVNDIRLDALYQQLLMQHVFHRPEPLAAMTSWSVAPEFAWWLFQHVTTTRPEKIIELGSGTSTLVIAAALKQLGVGRFLSFEHDHAYLEKTRALLQVCDLQNHVELIYAPLEEMQLDGQAYRWYDLPYDLIDHMVGREELDLLLVDGPPAATNRHARYPALARLRDYCNKSTLVLLDDAGREEEQEILGRWGELLKGKCSYQMLGNVRHGPALFQFAKEPMSLNGCEEASMNAASERARQEIEQELKSALQGVQQDQNDELVRSLLDSFFRLRERSLEELKVKTGEVGVQCKTFVSEVVSLKQQLAEEKLRLFEQNQLMEAAVRDSAKEQQTCDEALEAQRQINDRLTQELKDAKKHADVLASELQDVKKHAVVLTHERNSLRTELMELARQHKLVYKSLVYQLGMAFYRQTRSVVGWAKMPLAIQRVMRRHAGSGNPDVVEYLAHASQRFKGAEKARAVEDSRGENALDIAAYSEALQKVARGVKRNSVLWIASQVADEQGHQAALQFAEDNVDGIQRPGLNILRANASLHSEEDWLRYFNAYLAPFQLAPVSLSAIAGSRFSRLCVVEPLAPVEGPLISVIMPAFNAEATLRHAAQSILDQTWRNLQLIIVDDCSSDATWEIAQQISAQDSRVLALRNAANVGPYVSKNLALRLAKGEYITGQDADDWSLPQRLERDIEPILSSGGQLLAVLSSMVRMNSEGEFSRFAKVGSTSADGVRRIASISLLIKANYLRDVLGGWDSVRFGADSELIIRAEKIIGDKLARLDHIGMFCLDLDTSLTNDPAFGVSKVTGISPTRKAFRDSYTQWHANVKKESARLPFPHIERKFSAPEAMLVPLVDIQSNIACHQALLDK
ncbi:glycosyltransferase [Stutzerimonas xanthomarina]|uniref:glycosyltransferase n=1 Tax=Stutzerimonas xanthomarina TaxID=271420 RepID=UPI003AA82A24